MYHVGKALPPASIYVRESVSMFSGWSAPVGINADNPPLYVWHFDIIRLINGNYVMITTNGSDKLWMATSKDGYNWKYSNSALMTRNGSGWDSDAFYRPTITETENGFDLWYSGRKGFIWRIGKTSIVF